MKSRLDLHNILRVCLGNDRVYFSPPESIKLEYPCIVYHRDSVNAVYADNKMYNTSAVYSITVISNEPDIHDLSSDIPIITSHVHEALMALPYINYDRHYVADGLDHDVYKIIF
jgi:hypothetical protein